MLIRDNTWSGDADIILKLDGQLHDVVEGFSKIDGVWVPWDYGDGLDLNVVIGKKTLSGLQLRFPENE